MRPDDALVLFEGFKLEPQHVRVGVGSTVEWVHLGTHTDSHSVTMDGLNVESPALEPGGRFRHTFERVGVQHVYCSLYCWIAGTVEVVEALSAADEAVLDATRKAADAKMRAAGLLSLVGGVEGGDRARGSDGDGDGDGSSAGGAPEDDEGTAGAPPPPSRRGAAPAAGSRSSHGGGSSSSSSSSSSSRRRKMPLSPNMLAPQAGTNGSSSSGGGSRSSSSAGCSAPTRR
jgi:hypothetical protein